MSTTTIRLPDDLKAKVAEAAARAGTTAHGFILEAIAEKVAQEALRNEFIDEAERRYAEIVATGETIAWTDMRRYLEARQSGNAEATRPTPRKLAR